MSVDYPSHPWSFTRLSWFFHKRVKAELGGNENTVAVQKYSFYESLYSLPLLSSHSSTYRQVLSTNVSLMSIATGQVGMPLHENFFD